MSEWLSERTAYALLADELCVSGAAMCISLFALIRLWLSLGVFTSWSFRCDYNVHHEVFELQLTVTSGHGLALPACRQWAVGRAVGRSCSGKYK